MKKTTSNKTTLGHLLISTKEQFLLFFNKSLLSSLQLEPASFLFKTCQKLCLVFFFLGFFSANAATIYVNSATGSDVNAGTVGSPYKTFHKAYTMANSGDVINLTGTFDWTAVDETGDGATSGYTISKNLTIQGQGANSTTIQAANADNIADRRIFTISYGYTVVINNCTIRYGKTTDGGGIQVDGIATIESCDISYNRATGGSGGGLNCRGKVTLNNSLVSNNFANNMGGGVNRDYYSGNGGTPGASDVLVITNSTVAYNQVLANLAYFDGGGVFYRRGAGTITNSVISYNIVTNADASTNGIGTGDPSSIVNLKNNIIANNFRFNCWGGDIGQRQSSSSGSYVDNGNNIFGVKGYWSQGLTIASTSWLDLVANCSTPDGVFVLQNGQNCRSGQLYLSSTLNLNSSTNGVQNFAITDPLSIVINNGSSIANASISIPSNDMRGLSRVGLTDIGTFEYQSVVAPFAAPVSGSVSSTELICSNGTASDIVLTGSTGSIQWQFSTNGSTWSNVSGATGTTLTSTQIGAVTGTKFFRANVTNSGCSEVSNSAVVEINNGLALDGVGDFVNIGNHSSLNFTGNFTIESWVKVPATPKASINTIFSKNYPNHGTPGYSFAFNHWNTTNLFLTLEDGVGAISSNTPLTTGAWSHVAVVVSGNGTLGTFYLNGKAVGGGAVTLTNASAVNEFIGSMDASGSYSLSGTLDELRIWNVARTQQELLDNLDNPLVGNETALVAYYDFDQGVPSGTNSGLTVKDQTANVIDGTFSGVSLSGSTSNFVDGNHLSVIAPESNGCLSATAPKLSFGGTGKTPTAYQWYSNTSASTTGAISISGSTTSSYDAPTSTANTVFYYLNATGTCASSSNSNFAKVITQNPAISGSDYLYLNHSGNYTTSVTAASSNPWVMSNTAFATTSTIGAVTAVATGAPTLTFTSAVGCVSTKTINVVPVEWVGTTSTDWTNGSNWIGGYVPTNISTLGLNANATSDLVLNGSKTITTLTFNGANRKVDLGNYDLTISTITSSNATNYIKTSGTGKLIQTLASNASVTFPIGNTTYNPVAITNKSGASDVFSARVLVGAFMEGLTGAAITSTVLNRTWDISKTNANAGSGVDFVFNWNAGEVANGNFVTPKLNHYSSTTSNWEVPTVATSVFGSNMLTVTGYTGTFSPFTVAEGPTALPVEMVYFFANCSEAAVDIQWQTASEHNSDYFQLETSLDAVNWEIIQTIPAAGSSQELLNYSAIDLDAARKQKYYRLKQVDFNGDFKIYGPFKAECTVESTNIGLHPNPCATELTLSIASQIPTEVNYTLISPEGKVLENKQMAVQSGITLFTLDVSNYPSGMYMLQFDVNEKRFIKKLTVQ